MDNINNFLKSIEKHSMQEREQMLSEIEQKRNDELNRIKEKGESDSHTYIQKYSSDKKAQITSEYAVKNLEAQGEIYKKRDAMLNDIFKRAEDELIKFSQSSEYMDKLIKDAEEISKLFENKDCIIYVKDGDMKFSDSIKSVFNSSVEIKPDLLIRIGGLRGYCKSKMLVADNTLDSKLEAQKEWFIENAQLKVK